jgi:hypothetical protein
VDLSVDSAAGEGSQGGAVKLSGHLHGLGG